jgi:putative membrane protein
MKLPCLLLLTVATAAGAQTPTPAPSTSAANTPPSTTSARPAAPLSQSDALGVLSAVNQAEIAAGQLALKKVPTGPVHEYAQKMVTEHSDNDRKARAWSPNTGAAQAIAQKQKGQQELARLEPMTGDGFSKAYIAAMVKDHAAALDALDHKLIPAAKDAQVREFLTQTRAHVANHLAMARQLQGGTAGKGTDQKGKRDTPKQEGDVPQQEGPTG